MFERNPERVKFYTGSRWQRIRLEYLYKVNFLCERCGGPATIVHHRKPITDDNLKDLSITIDSSNLEALCLACHNKEHFGSKEERREAIFDSIGQVVGVK